MNDFSSGCLDVRHLVAGPLHNNVYLLTCRSTGDSLLIDAADDADRVIELIGSATVSTIVTTHRHHDHWQALAPVRDATGATTVSGRADADGIDVATDRRVGTGDSVAVGTCDLEILEIAGHTPGSIVLAHRGPERTHLFTGDCLFPGGVGKTASDEDFATLLEQVEDRIFARFDDDTVFHPGHGPASTLGTERPHLDDWRRRGW